jgi:hypothetical protein
MSEVKICPKCKLVNPPSAQRCDCGYDFISQSVQVSYLSPRERTSSDGCTRAGGYGCLALALLLFISGGLSTLAALNSNKDPAFLLGTLFGTFVFGLLSLGMAAYLLRWKG